MRSPAAVHPSFTGSATATLRRGLCCPYHGHTGALGGDTAPAAMLERSGAACPGRSTCPQPNRVSSRCWRPTIASLERWPTTIVTRAGPRARQPDEVVFEVRDVAVALLRRRRGRGRLARRPRAASPRSSARRAAARARLLRSFNRMNDLIVGAEVSGRHRVPRSGPLRAERRPGRGAPPHRHGVPEAEPVPEVDLRQRRVRPAHQRPSARASTTSWSTRSTAPRCGTRSRTSSSSRVRALGWPAAAAVHRALPRGRARRDPDGRAVLGARPDRDRAHRGPDGRAEARVHDRHRDPQHAAGRARVRHDGVLHGRRRRRRAAASDGWSSTTSTEKIFTNPSDPRTEGYITGRFG